MSGTYFVSPNDWLNILFRLCLASVLGAVIGWEREIRHKPTGLRTNALVSLGAALFVLVPLQLGAAEQTSDAFSRAIQGIATGVGFVGGGAILREARTPANVVEVHGLTSAAAIWVAAGLGVAAGCGLWQLGLISTLLSVLILKVLKRLEHR